MSVGRGRQLRNWLADSARFAGALFYWNARKSRYVWRRRTGPCPCQNQSDDPVPGQVRCDAVLFWQQPGRFRAVCPLLVATPAGWRCSVAPSGVRPFWARALAWAAVGLLAVWLAGVTMMWGTLRVVGEAPVNWPQLAWPGRWPEIKRLQSATLFARAIDAFRAGQLPEAHLLISTARDLDPRNYDASLLLAQITMFQGSFLFSDELFTTLWREYPEARRRTAVTYHDTLVSLGRVDRLAVFSLEMAAADPQQAVVWVRSALVGVRLMPPGEAAALARSPGSGLQKLAPHPRQLFQAALDRRTGRDIEALAALHRPFDGPLNPSYAQEQVARLAELAGGAEAQLLLGAYGLALGDFERLVSLVEIAAADRDAVAMRASFRALLQQPLNPRRVEQIATLLVTHPDANLFQDLQDRLLADPEFVAAVDGASLWVAASTCGAPAAAEYWQSHGQYALVPASFPDPSRLDFANWDVLAVESPLHLLNTVTFPREVALAILSKMSPRAARPAAPAARP